ncbi:MAG: hypothetical protein ABI821_07070 [Pseudomonadota bacterium]
MSSSFIIVKSAVAPQGLKNPLDLVPDPDFDTPAYRALAETLFKAVAWRDEVGLAESDVGEVELEPTEAALLVNFVAPITSRSAQILAALALSEGAVLINGTTADIVSPT